jgi:hypothetical protein
MQSYENEDRHFAEFRRKVRSAEFLSASTEQLLKGLHFSGRLSVVVQNGQVLKSEQSAPGLFCFQGTYFLGGDYELHRHTGRRGKECGTEILRTLRRSVFKSAGSGHRLLRGLCFANGGE